MYNQSEENQDALTAVFAAHPELQAVADKIKSPEFIEILEFFNLGKDLHETIEFEVMLVVGLFIPLSELPKNISESTGIAPETAAKLVQMIETILLEPILSDLRAYDVVLRAEDESEIHIPDADIELKERLELRPKGVERNTETPVRVPAAPSNTQATTSGEVTLADMKIIATPGQENKPEERKPLTKEEILGALSPRRTMASDIAAVRGEAQTKPVGTPAPIVEHLKEGAPQESKTAADKTTKPNTPLVGYDALSKDA